ncbi:hypothetical protein F5X68DRAFT_244044 [Plectosphaerella plurivora]|uniref:BZIP transcription factor n=1 Tax=Plectosphaerella plurivora TaxID=936078 RepID=A0A9P8VLL9_9PEZI|nr:hypothetical protein F5X68DRAFT_244044 [Plectosphaerella plurivora]
MASMQTSEPVDADPIPDKATARRLKKREQDRKAQRVARERKNNRIAHLEALVDQLSQDNADSEVPMLMDRLSRVTKEKEALVDILRSLETSIRRHIDHVADDKNPRPSQPALPPPSMPGETSRDQDSPQSGSASSPGGHPTEPPPASRPPGSLSWDAGLHQLPAETTGMTPAPVPWDQHPGPPAFELPFDSFSYVGEMPPHGPPHLSHSESSPNSSSVDDDVIVPLPPTADCPCLLGSRHAPGHHGHQSPGVNTWRAANEALGKAPTPLTPETAAAEDASSHDTPIRVILEGWDSAEAAGIMTESWRKLRQVDEVCFKDCGDIERLAILKTMHLLMTYHGDPTPDRLSGLPRWFWMRPSQALAHSYAIDYFVWPGVRERFVFSQHRYCTNLFWTLFRDNFRVTWNYGFRDCYMQDRVTGKFCLSPLFDQRLGDIRAWTMAADFFTHFPELCQDIPRCAGLPIPVGSARKDAEAVREEAQRWAVARASRAPMGTAQTPAAARLMDEQTDQASPYTVSSPYYFPPR